MEKIPFNNPDEPELPAESASEEIPEKITKYYLLGFTKDKPLQSPEVREMLVRWLEETAVKESSEAESVDYVAVAIEHAAMKYRLGFLTKTEVLQELEEAGGALASEPGDTTKLHAELSQLMYDIEDETFRQIHQ